jgi:integrase
MVLERAYSERASVYVLDHPGDIRASFETLVKASGLKDVTPHVLRHTWATRAAQAGVPMREIADWLGDTIQTVERHYYKRSPHYLTAAATWREHEAGK